MRCPEPARLARTCSGAWQGVLRQKSFYTIFADTLMTPQSLPSPASGNAPAPLVARTTVIDLVPFGSTGNDISFFALRLVPPPWKGWKPGQFVMVRQPGGLPDALWGRPFSLCRVTPDNLVLFFQVVGRVTASLATLKPGDPLDLWGPLGNSLAVAPEAPTLLLAGGIGIAPFVGYVESHPAAWNISMLFGHRMPLECYPVHSLNEKIMVDSFHEQSPEDLQRFLALMEDHVAQHAAGSAESEKNGTGKGLVLACGPLPFLRTVQGLAEKYAIRAHLCMESKMACGIGACLGCVVKTRSSEQEEPRHVQTCSCGPNFWADRVVL
jgi:2-polyprenylphenol hydroxylase and related flavodoxin oxidoreductases